VSVDQRLPPAGLTKPVFLVRHGETEWNALRRLQGHTDIGLNEVGRGQAERLAETLRAVRIEHVMSSDLARAHETARIIAGALGLTDDVAVDTDLRERGFGIFEGLTRDQCLADHGDAWRAWLDVRQAPPGGEQTPSVLERVDRAMRRASAVAMSGKTVLVVSHGGAIRLWLQAMTGTTVEAVANGAVFRVQFDEVVSASRWPAD
jgi:broad specificity phosphatase PhoE